MTVFSLSHLVLSLLHNFGFQAGHCGSGCEVLGAVRVFWGLLLWVLFPAGTQSVEVPTTRCVCGGPHVGSVFKARPCCSSPPSKCAPWGICQDLGGGSCGNSVPEVALTPGQVSCRVLHTLHLSD